MAHPNTIVDNHLTKHVGANYTVSGLTITLTGNIAPEQLESLEAGLLQQKYDKVVVGGVLKFQAR